MLSSESSDDLPLAQRTGGQGAAKQRKQASPAIAKPVASQIASSGTPTNGAARKSSASVPADEKEIGAKGVAKTASKAARKPSTHSQAKGKTAKGAAAVRASDRSGESDDVKKQSQTTPTAKKQELKAAAPAKKAAKPGTPGASPVKRERPRYDMPGQTQPTPDVGEPLAKFYLSLMQQRPKSEIAPKWCVQRGLLSREEADSWLQKQGKATGKAVKKDTAPKRAAKQASTAKAKQRRKQSDAFADDLSDDDDENYREDDTKPAKRAKTTSRPQPTKQSSAKAKPAPKHSRAAPNKGDAEESDDDSDDRPLQAKSSATEPAAKPVAKQPAKPAAKKAAKPVSKPKPPPVPSDSESSDAPLAQRVPVPRART